MTSPVSSSRRHLGPGRVRWAFYSCRNVGNAFVWVTVFHRPVHVIPVIKFC